MLECLRATTSRGLLNVLKDFSRVYFFVLSVNHTVHKVSPIPRETRPYCLTVWPVAGDWWLVAGTLTAGISTVIRCFDIRWIVYWVNEVDRLSEWSLANIKEFCPTIPLILSNEKYLQKFTSYRDAVWNFIARPNRKKIILLVLKRQLWMPSVCKQS